MAEEKVSYIVIETLDQPISPEQFFNNYVLKRKPVKFSFALDEFKVAVAKWRDNDYLISKAGKEIISTEVRNSLTENFGLATKQKMEFAEFLNLLTKNNQQKYYLTVQEIETNEFGPTLLYTSPLNKKLMSDIPTKPSFLKYLELYQINCWIGHSLTGTSSKLHHDYHDNLYTVIRGKKHFAIFPPNSVHSLYVNGADKISKIFDNGLITYNDDFREDGASKISVKKWNEYKDLPCLFDGDVNGNEMDEQEEILDKLLNEKIECMENNNNVDEYDDFDDLDWNENDDNVVQEPPLKRQRLDNSNDVEEKKHSNDPLSFSQIDLRESEDVIIEKYPKYAEVCKLKQIVVVGEGEMLYLPSGWFHDVTSFSNKELRSHFALNYWMHPPVKSGSIKQPYCDDFWKEHNKQSFE